MMSRSLVIVAAVLAAGAGQPVTAEEAIDWKRLKLTPAQSQQINGLEQEWSAKYMRLQPQILDGQRKLQRLFADPKADPLEIMNTQQSVARMQEELRNAATANHLRKRSILSEAQQRQYEVMLQQMLAERGRQRGGVAPQSDESSGLMDIIQKVRWAIQGR